MENLQDYINKKYPTDESKLNVEEIDTCVYHFERKSVINIESLKLYDLWYQDVAKLFDGGKLNISNFVNLKTLCFIAHEIKINGERDTGVYYNSIITHLNLSNCNNLKYIDLSYHGLTNVDFLNQLVNPENLTTLYIYDNNIQHTNIEVFKKFVNLERLDFGTNNIRENSIDKQKLNRFYGSLKSFEDFNNLKSLCFNSTDIDSGLEYLPKSLLKEYEDRLEKMLENCELTLENFIEIHESAAYNIIRCQIHNRNDAKCSKIYNQLKFYGNNLQLVFLLFPLQRVIEKISSEEDTKSDLINDAAIIMKNVVNLEFLSVEERQINLSEKSKIITEISDLLKIINNSLSNNAEINTEQILKELVKQIIDLAYLLHVNRNISEKNAKKNLKSKYYVVNPTDIIEIKND